MKMDNKQKEQLKKGLVFGGLGLLFALSMWFIFAPSGKDKSAAQQGLNDSIPQATTEQLTGNKLKAYELGDKSRQEEQTREEMGRLSDCFDSNTAPSESERAQVAASTAKIEMRPTPMSRSVRHCARSWTTSKRNWHQRMRMRMRRRSDSSP